MGQFLEALLVSQGNRCPYNGEYLVPGVNCWLDHRMPVSRFPELAKDPTNVEWVDKRINLAKGDMTPEEFLGLCKLVSSRVTSVELDDKRKKLKDLAKSLGVEIEFL